MEKKRETFFAEFIELSAIPLKLHQTHLPRYWMQIYILGSSAFAFVPKVNQHEVAESETDQNEQSRAEGRRVEWMALEKHALLTKYLWETLILNQCL